MSVNLIQDAYTVCTLAKSSAFSLTAIVTLAIGIGAATAIFNMVNGVPVQRLPIDNCVAARSGGGFPATRLRNRTTGRAWTA